mmetsp:Transcript_24297/g.41589  ORF Transcript_24297/g.41589 Transcript_24297/m.41589 type:complete len:112 (+) Transcript_24297:301-636(+)
MEAGNKFLLCKQFRQTTAKHASFLLKCFLLARLVGKQSSATQQSSSDKMVHLVELVGEGGKRASNHLRWSFFSFVSEFSRKHIGLVCLHFNFVHIRILEGLQYLKLAAIYP